MSKENINKEAIRFDQVSKTFPKADKPSVYDTSLIVPEGSFVTILGASGCGKTTLLKMVNRIIEPTSGTISLFGKNIVDIPVTELRQSIGYVIQQVGLFPHMSIEQNIAIVPNILGWDSARITQRIDYLLELIHLPQSYKKQYPRQLSGGQQQRVGIARAMAGDPNVLLMDEPFGAIDAITRTKLQDDFKQIQRELGKTVLFVTHDVDEALKMGDRIIVMNEGRIQQYDTPLAMLSNPSNSFVSRLIQADDLFQQLHLTRAEEKMVPWSGGAIGEHILRVRGDESLKNVLQLLLQHNIPYVAVESPEHGVVGTISLEQLKQSEAGERDDRLSYSILR